MNHNEPSLSHGYLQAPPEQTVVCGLGAPLFSSLLCLGLSFTSCVPVSASYLAVLSDPPVLSFASCCIFALSASTNLNDCFFFPYSSMRFSLCCARACIRKEHSVLVELGTQPPLLPAPLMQGGFSFLQRKIASGALEPQYTRTPLMHCSCSLTWCGKVGSQKPPLCFHSCNLSRSIRATGCMRGLFHVAGKQLRLKVHC